MNNKKIIKYKCHLSPYRGKMQQYCSMLQKFGTYGTSDKAPFLCLVCQMCQIFGIWHIWHICCGCRKKEMPLTSMISDFYITVPK